METNKLTPAVTGQQSLQDIIEIYKREFGNDWITVFRETVTVQVP